MKLVSPRCFSLLALVSWLANQVTSTNITEPPSFAPTPGGGAEYEALSPEYYYDSHAPAPAPETEYDEVLIPESPSPPPFIQVFLVPKPAFLYDEYHAAFPAPSMPQQLPVSPSSDDQASNNQQLQAPPVDDSDAVPTPPDDAAGSVAVPIASVLPSSDDSADEDKANEFFQEQNAARSKQKEANGVLMLGAWVCIVGLARFLYKNRTDDKRIQYESLAEKEVV